MKALTRDQAILLLCLVVITGLAWLYLAALAATMPAMSGMGATTGMAGMSAAAPAASGSSTALLVAGVMWVVMMAGMMLPGAAPMILLFAAAERRQGALPLVTTPAFVLGYLVIWTVFALAALGVQWALMRAGLFAPGMKVTSGILGGAVFIAAGIYEWSPLKERCLALCQSPLGFIAGHWRPGIAGALRMGLRHGAYCLGCCWVLMLLLFVGGVMNLVWVAGLTVLVLLQKIWPGVTVAARVTGLAMLAAGVYLMIGAL